MMLSSKTELDINYRQDGPMFVPEEGYNYYEMCSIGEIRFFPASLADVWEYVNEDFIFTFTRPIHTLLKVPPTHEADRFKEFMEKTASTFAVPSWAKLLLVVNSTDALLGRLIFTYDDESISLDEVKEFAWQVFQKLTAMEPPLQIYEAQDCRPRTVEEMKKRQGSAERRRALWRAR